MVVYDYKFPTLAQKLYYHYKINQKAGNLPDGCKFNIINFVDVEYSRRVNPIQQKYIGNLAAASETAETLFNGSSYFLGGSLHYGDLYGEATRKARPVVWAYAEQSVTDALSLVAAYSHAFSSDNACRNFCGIGGKYAIKRVELGLFSDYTRIEGVDEWATEVTCNIQCNKHISLQPAIHVITTGGKTNCVGIMRLAFSL